MPNQIVQTRVWQLLFCQRSRYFLGPVTLRSPFRTETILRTFRVSAWHARSKQKWPSAQGHWRNEISRRLHDMARILCNKNILTEVKSCSIRVDIKRSGLCEQMSLKSTPSPQKSRRGTYLAPMADNILVNYISSAALKTQI